MKIRNYLYLLVALLLLPLLSSCGSGKKSASKGSASIFSHSTKEEFRGVWIQTAFQDRFQRMTTEQNKVYLENLVQNLYETGFNAIIFQIRPEGDAFYNSPLEPWSRFLTGKQGRRPNPYWDPMEYMIKLCHDRHMEFHAWINPYRMSASKNQKLDSSHLYYQHPEWFVFYDERLYLNPGLPESRAHIRQVVKDIVKRYDIDAIHMDDYFYPYPSGSLKFDDRQAFESYGPIMGYDLKDPAALGNFRRRNVNILIKSLNEDIKAVKPWVRFGISPFGIYRNKKSWSEGSKTNGTQCFDDLYADVLLWAQSGWIDYIIPQVYWEIGHQLADYQTLCKWWGDHIPSNCHLYIGQSIERSLDDPANSNPKPNLMKSSTHFINKINQARGHKNIRGNCFWYAFQVEDNAFSVRDFLQQSIFSERAMVPPYTNLSDKLPEKVTNLSGELAKTSKGTALHLHWTPGQSKQQETNPKYYNVYRFKKGESINLNDMNHLYLQCNSTEFYDYDISKAGKYTYVVTAVDAYNNEGKSVKKSFKINLK